MPSYGAWVKSLRHSVQMGRVSVDEHHDLLSLRISSLSIQQRELLRLPLRMSLNVGKYQTAEMAKHMSRSRRLYLHGSFEELSSLKLELARKPLAVGARTCGQHSACFLTLVHADVCCLFARHSHSGSPAQSDPPISRAHADPSRLQCDGRADREYLESSSGRVSCGVATRW